MAVDMNGNGCERVGRLRKSAFPVFNTGTHYSVERRLSAVLLKTPCMGQGLKHQILGFEHTQFADSAG